MEDDELPATQPVDTMILKDVVAFVDVRAGHNNQSKCVAEVLQDLGATISTKFDKKVTHVIFKEGGQGTYRKAKKLGVHLLSVLWVENCRKNAAKVKEHLFPAIVSEAYDLPVRLRKMKSWQPVDLEEDLARSAARIKRREKAAFRREIRRKCFIPSADGRSLQLSPERIPYVYEDNSIPDVVLTPSAFDNYKSSSDDSSEEPVLPLVQRLFMQYPDSPEIKEYIQTNGRFRVRNNVLGNLQQQRVSSGKLPHMGHDQKLDYGFMETPLSQRSRHHHNGSQAKLTATTPCRETENINGNGCILGNVVTHSKGIDSNGGSAETPIRKLASDSDNPQSYKTPVLNGVERDFVRHEAQSDNTKPGRESIVATPACCPKLASPDDAGILHTISNLNIGRKLRRSGRHKGLPDATVSDNSEAEIVEKQTKSTPKVRSRKSLGPTKRKLQVSHCILDNSCVGTAEPLAVEKPEMVVAPEEKSFSSFPQNLHDRRTSAAFIIPTCQNLPADKTSGLPGIPENVESCKTSVEVSLPNVSAIEDNLTLSTGKTKRRSSRNSLDEFKPLFSRRSRRLLSIDECESPDEVRVRRKSVSKMPARPNMATKHIVLTSFEISEKETLVPILKMLGGYRLSYQVDRYTTHLVTGANRRTINSLLATVRGCWILSKEWVFKSLEAGKWLDEEPYELSEAFPAAKVYRLERSQIEEDEYACNLFGDVGSISITSTFSVPNQRLNELLKLAGGNVVRVGQNPRINIGTLPTGCDALCINELWVLDSVTQHRTLPFEDYLVQEPSKRRRSSWR